jgi:tryptophan synthase alpha chain
METRVEGLVQQLKQSSPVPVAVGFGISGPEQVQQVRRWGADGAIVGSALVKRMAAAGAANMASEAETFCRELRQACD